MVGNSAPKVFDCPSCGAGVVVKAQGLSLSVVCGSCGSVIDPTNTNYQIISKFQLNSRIKPLIPLHTRFKLKGDLWEPIGFMVRSSGGYSWNEYLLYNPFKGFRWLTEYDGHWTFVTVIKERPRPVPPHNCNYLGKVFRPNSSGDATVTYVLGEFYWRVKAGEVSHYSDYVAPPYMLSAERDSKDTELTWSYGEYIEPSEITAATGIPLSGRLGVGACQPFPYQDQLSSLFGVAKIFLGIILILHVFKHGILWNLIVCGALILAPPLLLAYYKNNFEAQRENSGDDFESTLRSAAGYGSNERDGK